MKKLLKLSIFSILIFSCFLIFLTVYYSYNIPITYRIFKGQEPKFSYFGVEFSKINEKKLSVNPSQKFVEDEFYEAKLFNLIPLKKVNVKKYSKTYVFPCGTPFGVKVLTDGVMVTNTVVVKTKNGEKNPSKEAGLKKGDIIEEINEKKVSSNDDLKNVVFKGNGEEIRLKYNRNFRNYETTLKPVLSEKENRWLTGLWVRDSSAGLGTTTFCTKDGIFAGLGHAICDIDTGEKLPLGSGEIVRASINSVKKGACGNAGELCGSFNKGSSIGNAKINSDFGLYGKLYKPISIHDPVIVGFKQEARVGKASIYCTVEGEKSKKYDILIESIDYKSASRNFVIKITDEKLLEKTGGIVQGMSGSPIIQDGKFIGAVTHVFLKDSTRGYGIFAETMLEITDRVKSMDNIK